MMQPPSPPAVRARHDGPMRRVAQVTATVLVLIVSVFAAGTGVSAADAPHGAGLGYVTTNGFTHPWQGGWVTNAGIAWCIDTGSWDPRASGNTPIGDLPAARGVSAQNRDALAYALWAYGATTDPSTAAGLATVVHGLSGDTHASTNVPSMSVSNPSVYNSAVSIFTDAQTHAFWVGPWQVAVRFAFNGGSTWTSTTTVTASNGAPIVGAHVSVTPHNVIAAQQPDVARDTVTDSAGQIQSTWTQSDRSTPISLDADTNAPGYYQVWQGSAYSSGEAAQKVITGTGTSYSGHAQGTIPAGFGRVRKVTTNPAYQSATGATYAVQPAGGGASLGTLTVAADGTTNTLALPVGDYQVIETSAPAGVTVDPAPHRFTVTAQTTTTLELTDTVTRRGELDLIKVDSTTGDPVAGATFRVTRDDNRDGTYGTTIGTFTSGLTPVTVGGLAAGNYRVTETAPPPGYLAPAVASQDVTLTWNQTARVVFDDHKIPTITTAAQTPELTPGATVRDIATISGLGNDQTGTVTTVLYGPFASTEALTNACAARQLGNPVGTVAYPVTGSGTSLSPAITLPTSGGTSGVYTFIETLHVPGYPPVTHNCGSPPETFTVAHPPAPVAQPTSGSNGVAPTNGQATLPETGAATGLLATFGAAMCAMGLAAMFVTRRRHETI